MKRPVGIVVPDSAETRLKHGLCPIHGVKLAAAGRGADGVGIFSCPVPHCEISASVTSASGPFELLKAAQNLDLTPKRLSRKSGNRYK